MGKRFNLDESIEMEVIQPGEQELAAVLLGMSKKSVITVANDGGPRSGKSTFGVSAPGPVGVIPLDRNTRWTVMKAAHEMGVKVVMPKKDFIRQDDPIKLARMDEETSRAYYRKHVDSIKTAYYQLIENRMVRSIMVDTFTQFSDDVLYANYGRTTKIMPRDRGTYNAEMLDFVNACNKHLILVHKSKQVWVNDKPTDEMERQGWKGVSYPSNVCVQHFRDMDRHEEKCKEGKRCLCFGIRISECQHNPFLVGDEKSEMFGSRATFAGLAMRLHPGTTKEDWK